MSFKSNTYLSESQKTRSSENSLHKYFQLVLDKNVLKEMRYIEPFLEQFRIIEFALLSLF